MQKITTDGRLTELTKTIMIPSAEKVRIFGDRLNTFDNFPTARNITEVQSVLSVPLREFFWGSSAPFYGC